MDSLDTLIEIIADFPLYKKKAPIQSVRDCQDEKLIRESKVLSNTSPSQESKDETGCRIPFKNFINCLSPPKISRSSNEEKAITNNLYTEKSYSSNSYDQIQELRAGLCNEKKESQKFEKGYYPGSMLKGNLGKFTESPNVLENYLNDNNFMSNFEDESLANSCQQLWQNIFYLPSCVLPPLMISSYQEIATLQDEIKNIGSENVVLPIFLQNYQIWNDEKKQEIHEELDGAYQKTFTNLNFTAKDSDEWQNYDHVLRKCQRDIIESNCFSKEHKNETNTTTEKNSLISSHNDSMKYLEEAAVKLLQASADNNYSGRRRYVKRDKSTGSYQCSICNKVFSRLFTLTTHERVHSGSKPYKCEFCNRYFRQSGTKRNHIRAVHAKEKPYKCEFCEKKFGHKSSLVVHTRIHTKEKPYKCEICERTFTDRATYKKHDAIHSQEKKYKCNICGKCLTQHSNLKRHIKYVHKETIS